MNNHWELAGEIIDRIAAADANGISTKDLSFALTIWARKNNTIETLGTFNATGNYWEVTGTQISAILRKLSNKNLVKGGIRSGAQVWQWKPTIEAEAARRERVVEAQNAVCIFDRTTWDVPTVVVTLHGTTVATFLVTNGDGWERLSADTALAAAEALARTLRRSIAQNVV